ncbi:MAG: DoxX family protein [Acidobacteriia bacterium]|nr:DoxX family protein [Terriglobia bacterium]
MSSSGTSAWGLLLLRLAVGAVFVMHGGQKIFVTGFRGVAGFLAHLGFPLPLVAAIVLMLVEFVGGLALIFGIFTRWAAALSACVMVVAVLLVHLKRGFFTPGVEFPMTLLAASLALALSGPGALALGTKVGKG